MACTILYNNINGFKGKSISVEQIIQKINAYIVVLCETKLENVNKAKEAMPDFDIVERCIKSGKGGILIGV